MSIGFLKKIPEHFLSLFGTFTFSVQNESDVPFRPERATVLFYTADGRIDDRLQMTYDEMRTFMDSDDLTRAGTPLYLYFGAELRDPPQTSAKCVLRGTDANGHELTFYGYAVFTDKNA